jgi:hypothetical protein
MTRRACCAKEASGREPRSIGRSGSMTIGPQSFFRQFSIRSSSGLAQPPVAPRPSPELNALSAGSTRAEIGAADLDNLCGEGTGLWD